MCNALAYRGVLFCGPSAVDARAVVVSIRHVAGTCASGGRGHGAFTWTHKHTAPTTPHMCTPTVLECLIILESRIADSRYSSSFQCDVNLMILYARRPGYVKFASDATARLKCVSPAALRHPWLTRFAKQEKCWASRSRVFSFKV